MKNESLINASKKLLLNLLVQCTDGQKLMFNRLYCHEKLDATPEEAVEQMDASNIDWAISQIERSLAKNNNYEKIKLACQKANPKLMELSFGAKILVTNKLGNKSQETIVTGKAHFYKNINGRAVHDHVFIETFSGLGLTRHKLDDIEYEILGHEPAWSDVLLALKGDFRLGNNGEVARWGGQDWDLMGYVDLTKPVKDQSEKTLQFIADLL